ncbi:MAG: SIMPL domain-containing protein [Alphaproteobacteria bacterium]|nr:SIMPL domain-containing protein [Alphaproteobacteria bacterium]
MFKATKNYLSSVSRGKIFLVVILAGILFLIFNLFFNTGEKDSTISLRGVCKEIVYADGIKLQIGVSIDGTNSTTVNESLSILNRRLRLSLENSSLRDIKIIEKSYYVYKSTIKENSTWKGKLTLEVQTSDFENIYEAIERSNYAVENLTINLQPSFSEDLKAELKEKCLSSLVSKLYEEGKYVSKLSGQRLGDIKNLSFSDRYPEIRTAGLYRSQSDSTRKNSEGNLPEVLLNKEYSLTLNVVYYLQPRLLPRF